MSLYVEHLTPHELAELRAIQDKARKAHQKVYEAKRKKGEDYPDLPYECSWVYEMEFCCQKLEGQMYEGKRMTPQEIWAIKNPQERG